MAGQATNDARAQALGRRFREAAREAGLYRERNRQSKLMVSDISRKTGLPKGEISKIEAGTRGAFPSFDTIESLAPLLGVRARWLATGDGPKKEATAYDVMSTLLDHPKLRQAIVAAPTRWRASTLSDALHPDTLEAKTRSHSDGTPEGGWAALLDDIQHGSPHDEASTLISDAVTRQAGRARRLPPDGP